MWNTHSVWPGVWHPNFRTNRKLSQEVVQQECYSMRGKGLMKPTCKLDNQKVVDKLQLLVFFSLRFWISFWLPFMVTLSCIICNCLELEPVILYLQHFGMITLHFAWYLLNLAMFAFHFAWYLPHVGNSTTQLHGVCYILVLHTFMVVS